MHTLMVISGGVLLLVLLGVIGWRLNGAAGAAKASYLFIPLWLVCAVVNLTVGVMSAGYTVAQETPILLVVFGVPAVIAFVAAKQLSKTS